MLYGSQAQGEASSESDYDLLVLTSAPLAAETIRQIHDALYELKLNYGVVISTRQAQESRISALTMSPQYSIFRENVLDNLMFGAWINRRYENGLGYQESC